MFMKVIKKNQIVVFVVALMLIVAGYLNFSGDNTMNNLIPTSTLADSEEMASIGDAKLVSANIVEENNEKIENSENEEMLEDNPEQPSNVQSNINNIENNANTTPTTGETIGVEEAISTNGATTEDNYGSENYFTQSRLDRDTMYSQTLDTYQKIINNENISEDQKSIAQEEISKINKERNSIMIAENLIKVKGFEDLIIFVNGENVSIIVKADKLEEKDIAQIQNIITRELGASVENINISNK